MRSSTSQSSEQEDEDDGDDGGDGESAGRSDKDERRMRGAIMKDDSSDDWKSELSSSSAYVGFRVSRWATG